MVYLDEMSDKGSNIAGKIALELRGDPKDDEHVRLEEFVDKLAALKNALACTEKLLSDGKQAKTFYKVINLSHNSPATIELEAAPKKISDNQSERVVEAFLGNLLYISKTGTPPKGFDYLTLVAYKELCSLQNKKLQGMRLFGLGEILTLDHDLEKKIQSAFGPDESHFGNLSGRLEVINVHKKNHFTIFPLSGGKGIECAFTPDLESSVATNLKKRVLVYGRIFFKLWNPQPYRIDVERIERLPEEGEIPRLSGLKGILPNGPESEASKTLDDSREDDW